MYMTVHFYACVCVCVHLLYERDKWRFPVHTVTKEMSSGTETHLPSVHLCVCLCMTLCACPCLCICACVWIHPTWRPGLPVFFKMWIRPTWQPRPAGLDPSSGFVQQTILWFDVRGRPWQVELFSPIINSKTLLLCVFCEFRW